MATQIRYVNDRELSGSPSHEVENEELKIVYVEDGPGYKELVRLPASASTPYATDDRQISTIIRQEGWNVADFPNKAVVNEHVQEAKQAST